MSSKTEEYLALACCSWQHNFFSLCIFQSAILQQPVAVKGLVQRFNRQAAYP